jgi:hypothetical protein
MESGDTVGNRLRINVLSIYNYNGPRVEYTKTDTSPAISVKSLPELGSATTSQRRTKADEKLKVDDESVRDKGRDRQLKITGSP